jgi:LPS export ABC transporter protein LptC
MNRSSSLAAAALSALLALGGAGCRDSDEGPTATEVPESAPSEGIRGITLQNFHVADARWVLHADTASVYREGKKRVEAQWVSIDFYQEEEHISTLTSDRATLVQATDDLEARGNVRVVSDDGAVLKTDVLFWDHARAKIHTDQFVEITRGDNVLTGVGLEADPGLDRVDLKESVRGHIPDAGSLVDEEDSTE